MMVSVVVPVYNEEAVLKDFYAALTSVLDRLPYETEILFINDGSVDRTSDILQKLKFNDERVRVLEFSRNFGHQIAITAGLDHADGDVCITMDSDLQHPPEIIPQLLERWKKQMKVVHAVRNKRPGESLVKKQSSTLFYHILRRIANIPIEMEAGDFRLLDRVVVDAIKQMRERHRFIRGLSSWVGFSQDTVYYQQQSRRAGKSKYTFSRMLRFGWDGITSFSSFPLQLASYIGFVFSSVAGLYGLYAIYAKWSGHAVPGWTSIISVILFLGGLQLLMLGVFGQYLGRMYEEVRERPLYILKEPQESRIIQS